MVNTCYFKYQFLICILIAFAAMGVVSCAEYLSAQRETYTADGPDFTEERLLTHVNEHTLSPAYAHFQHKTARLEQAVVDWCAVLSAPDADVERTESTRTNVKQSWRDAMLAYHVLDAIPVGPIETFRDVHGVKYRESIYSGPIIKSCDIDAAVVARAQQESVQQGLSTDREGLQAIEYLVFTDPVQSNCRNSRTYRKIHEWFTQGTMRERAVPRCAHVLDISRDIARKADQLTRAWQNDFGPQLIRRSHTGRFGEASGEFTQAILNVERTKDDRLGRPLGLNNCPEENKSACAKYIEHPYSELGLAAIVVRLRTAEQIGLGDYFIGSEALTSVRGTINTNRNTRVGLGFDDLLIAKGRVREGDLLRLYLRDVRTRAEKLLQEGTFALQIRNEAGNVTCGSSGDSGDDVCGFYARLFTVSTWLKTDYLAALSLLGAATNAAGDVD